MSNDILIRSVPTPVRDWIDNQRQPRNLSQREFVIEILETARVKEEPLFEYAARCTYQTPATEGLPFTFIDLFAGIGGLRLGLQKAGGRCVFSSEWDRYCQKTYRAWFGETPQGDIRAIKPVDIPNHDLLAAGFPCQPFSIAGVSKKNSLGRAHGFKDATQGTLFFQVATIIEIKRPPAVLLENVKNLLSHDQGRTWKVIYSTLEELGYKVFHQIIDADNYVPQHRERVFIAAFDKNIFGNSPPFVFPGAPQKPKPRLGDILETNPDSKYTLTDHLWNYLQAYAQRHKEKGNGFGFGLVGSEDRTRTLSARYYKDGSEILVKQKRKNPRRLSPREAARLMGFPDEFPIVVSDTQAYRQFAQASIPQMAEDVTRAICRVFVKNRLEYGLFGGKLIERENTSHKNLRIKKCPFHDWDPQSELFYKEKLREVYGERNTAKKRKLAHLYALKLRHCREAAVLAIGENPFERGINAPRSIFNLLRR
jgi:DNA (cytosine-5)-methyltransferase 1